MRLVIELTINLFKWYSVVILVESFAEQGVFFCISNTYVPCVYLILLASLLSATSFSYDVIDATVGELLCSVILCRQSVHDIERVS